MDTFLEEKIKQAQSYHEITIPWSKDEYIIVNGQKLVYQTGNNAITNVIFYGGFKHDIVELMQQGYKIVMPERLRITRGKDRR